MSPRPALALFALVLAACSGASCAASRGAAAGEGDGGGSTVTPRFGWPDDFHAQVSLDHRTIRDGNRSTRALVRHQLSAERKNGDLWVRVSNIEGEGDEPDLRLNLAIGETLVQVVSRDGAFKRAEGLDQAMAILRRAEGGESAGDKARESIRRQVREDWEQTVGAWRGRRLVEGQTAKAEQEAPLSLLPSVLGVMDVEYLYRGRVACEEGQPELRCVELWRRMRPARKSQQEILAQVAAGLPPPQASALRAVTASSEVDLVTEPDTLIPHRLLVRDVLGITVEGVDGAQHTVTERSEDSYHFTTETAL